MSILDSRMFETRYKLRVHFIQIFLIIIVIGVSVPRLFMKGQPRTRANTIALGMGAKSLIIIAYEILSERYHKWYSLKANLILNCLETVFWGAVIFLVMQANLQICIAVGCILGWITVGVAVMLNMLASYTAVLSWKEWRAAKDMNRARSHGHVELEDGLIRK